MSRLAVFIESALLESHRPKLYTLPAAVKQWLPHLLYNNSLNEPALSREAIHRGRKLEHGCLYVRLYVGTEKAAPVTAGFLFGVVPLPCTTGVTLGIYASKPVWFPVWYSSRTQKNVSTHVQSLHYNQYRHKYINRLAIASRAAQPCRIGL